MFFVRILIYGLVAFIPGDNGTTILLPRVGDHSAYVALKADCAECKRISPFGGNSFEGFFLQGEQVVIGGVAIAEVARGPLASTGRPRSPLPNDPTHAASLEWIPSMKSVLEGSGNLGRVDSRCLQANPIGCNIAGRVHFARSERIQTCELIDSGGQVTAFDFKINRGARDSTLKQGLAEILELVSAVRGDEIKLSLNRFAGGTQTVTLKPKPCSEGSTVKCVDIYIANVPRISRDEGDRIEGLHFLHLYNLLADQQKGDFRLRPVIDVGVTKPVRLVQPPCRSVLVSLADMQGPVNLGGKDVDEIAVAWKTLLGIQELFDLRSSMFSRDVDYHLLSPEIRPVCPMALFSP